MYSNTHVLRYSCTCTHVLMYSVTMMREPESSEKHIMKKQNRVLRYHMRTSAKKTMNIEHTQKQRLPTKLNIKIFRRMTGAQVSAGVTRGQGCGASGVERGGGRGRGLNPPAGKTMSHQSSMYSS